MRHFLTSLILSCFIITPLCEATFTDVDNWPYRANDEEVASFEDISATGTRVLNGSDNGTSTIDIGFTFQFYHQNFTQVSVSPNGLVTLGGDNGQETNVDLTTTAPTGNLPSIAVLWDDWHFISDNDGLGCCSDADGVYYETLGTNPERRFIIQWNRAYGVTSSPSSVTFEVILYESTNRIVMLYSDVTSGDTRDAGAEATVGIRNTSGQVACLDPVTSPTRCFTPTRCEERIQWSFNSGAITSTTVLEYNNSPHYVFEERFANVNPGANSPEGIAFSVLTSTLWVQGQQNVTGADAMAEITKNGVAVSDFIGRGTSIFSSTQGVAVLSDGRLVTTHLSFCQVDPDRFGGTIYQTDGTIDLQFNLAFDCVDFVLVNPATLFNSDTGKILYTVSDTAPPHRFVIDDYNTGSFVERLVSVDPSLQNDPWNGGTYHRDRHTIWTVDSGDFLYEMDTSGNELHRYNFSDCTAHSLSGLTFDDDGNLYLTDRQGDSVRKLNPFSVTGVSGDWGWTHRP